VVVATDKKGKRMNINSRKDEPDAWREERKKREGTKDSYKGRRQAGMQEGKKGGRGKP
jgi:hypothetical protein